MRKTPRSNGQEERIFVAVRIRPLNLEERARHDVSKWECVSSNAIRFKNSLHEPSSPFGAYTFDKVFGDGCSTQQVYEGGIKQVVLSVVSGTNSSVFAYGQTSSGKTYTMTGITEYAVKDIYDYIEKNPDREFILKFSAMEIYNEIVRDLLSTDNTPLRLLDDPMKGTVIDKLKEEVLTDWSHLQELLSICAAERTTKETSMNETSSRSHQILRLTIESSPSHYVGKDKSGTLVASVNFIDLAGSERASQALTVGNRLREGAHINRSLLTLGTVIRKLSKGGNGHIPYRDSKLTRILQNSLGGNARTAIICTISPARSHVEQSKNTLLFASCAKQVATNAQVNVMMSDKVLVKHLQNELARLQNELRSFEPNTMMLKERELQIEKMDKEIKELTRQRDIFQSHVENCLQSVGKDHIFRAHKGSASKAPDVAYNHLDTNNRLEDNCLLDGNTSEFIEPDPFENSNNPRAVESFFNKQLFQESENPEDNFLLDGNTPEFFGPDPCQGWEEIASRVDAKYGDNYTEVQRIEGHKEDLNMFPVSEDIGGKSPIRLVENGDAESSSWKEDNELTHVTVDKDQDDIQQKIQCVEDHKVDLNLFVPISENVGGKSPMRFVEIGDIESFSRKEDNDLSLVTVDNHQEVLQQNIQCIEDHKADLNMFVPVSNDIGAKSPMRLVENGDIESSSREEENELTPITVDNHQDVLQQKVEALQRTINHLVGLSEKYNGSSESFISQSGSSQLTRSKSWRSVLATTSHLQSDKLEYGFMLSPQLDKLEQKVVSPSQFDNLVKESALPPKFNKPKEETIPLPTKVEKDYYTSLTFQDKFSEWEFHVEKRKSPKGHFQTHKMDAIDEVEYVADSDTEDTASILNFVVKINGRSKTVPSKDFDNLMECERTSGLNELRKTRVTSFHGVPGALLPCEFERQQRYMVELWDAYNVPLVHRSYFFLLIKGELTDSVYLDVELRRLSFLTGTRITQDGQNLTPDSSLRALNREREMLSEKMHKKFSRKQKEKYYLQWGIDLKSKQRSKQLAWRIWTNTKDMDHLRESATLVGKLIGLVESNETSKKTFGLKFLSLFNIRKSHSWEDMSSGM